MTALPRHPIAAAPSSLAQTASPPRAPLEKGHPGAGRDDIDFAEYARQREQLARMAEAFHETADGKTLTIRWLPPTDHRSIWDVEFGMNWQSFVALGFVMAFVGTVVWWFMALVGDCAGCGL